MQGQLLDGSHIDPSAGQIVRCDCPRLRSDDVEWVVWEAVRDLLAQPDRLLSMAAAYLGVADEHDGVTREHLADADRRIASLERALGRAVAQGPERDLDPVALKHATDALTADLAAARRHRDGLAALAGAHQADDDRVRRLRRVADTMGRRLANPSLEQMAAVFDLLDVRVTVAGWAACTACNGHGKVQGGTGGLTCSPKRG